MDAGAGAHVDDVIGREDRLAIVLDDEHGVAEVAEARLRLEEARVVARVEADRRLVEHVEHADEGRADLRGEADALPFAARERLGAAIEREVVEADVDEEAEPRGHGAEERLGDGALARGELRVLGLHRGRTRRRTRRGAECGEERAELRERHACRARRCRVARA